MTNDILYFLNTNLGTSITIIIVIAFSIIAVLRFGVKFDLNAYLESRKKRHRALAQVACPHMVIEKLDNNSDNKRGVSITPLFFSPYGTPNYICKRCGAVWAVYSEEEIMSAANYFVNHSKEYRKRIKKYERHAKKAL